MQCTLTAIGALVTFEEPAWRKTELRAGFSFTTEQGLPYEGFVSLERNALMSAFAEVNLVAKGTRHGKPIVFKIRPNHRTLWRDALGKAGAKHLRAWVRTSPDPVKDDLFKLSPEKLDKLRRQAGKAMRDLVNRGDLAEFQVPNGLNTQMMGRVARCIPRGPVIVDHAVDHRFPPPPRAKPTDPAEHLGQIYREIGDLFAAAGIEYATYADNLRDAHLSIRAAWAALSPNRG